jgi:hypothetical protein
MSWLKYLILLNKFIFMKEFQWPELPESGFVKGRLASSQDLFSGNALFFSAKKHNEYHTSENIDIPQYALHIKSKWLKIPCIIIQVEGTNNAYLVGYQNLLNHEKSVGWINEFKFLGTTPPQKKDW